MATDCDSLSPFQHSDGMTLDNCTTFDTSGNDRDPLHLLRVLKGVKHGKLRAFVQDYGINCIPANGIHMTSISTHGYSNYCKASVGHLSRFDTMACSYYCNCPFGCAMFRARIVDPTNKVICAFLA